jgi:hypothetical protein
VKIEKAVTAAIAAAALAAAPAAADAKTKMVYCGFRVSVINVNCRTALAVKKYWEGHEILAKTVRISGRTWRMTIKRGSPFYYTDFKSGNSTVDIQSAPYG